MMALVSVSRENAHAAERHEDGTSQTLAHLHASETVVNHRLRKRFPPERIEEIKRKELQRYQQDQKKKWNNWIEAVSR